MNTFLVDREFVSARYRFHTGFGCLLAAKNDVHFHAGFGGNVQEFEVVGKFPLLVFNHNALGNVKSLRFVNVDFVWRRVNDQTFVVNLLTGNHVHFLFLSTL